MTRRKRYSEEELQRLDWIAKNRILESTPTIGFYYPTVLAITFELHFKYSGAEHIERKVQKKYSLSDKSYFNIDCINPTGVHCNFDLRDEVSMLINQKGGNATGTKICQGWQDSERIGSYHCNCEMDYIITVQYQNA
jgi:hypothetical protein